ncbi:MAG TPA: BadF/BadG/BcrA/BcrD ATPase family protein [Dermatophilaceae bacterium]
MSRSLAVLAVDVGGSGLRAERVELAGDEHGSSRTRVAQTTGRFEGAGAAITGGGIDLEALLTDVEGFDSRHRERPDVVVWSMRGLLGLTEPEDVVRQVHSRLGPARTVVASDAVTSLVGALGAVRPGAVLAAGSGVVALATDFADVWRMVDGWGHVLADRGSGAWIGLEGLRAALATEDRVPGGSQLLHEAAVLAWGEPRLWPRLVMTTPDAQARLAGFAPVVAGLAGRDGVAAQLVAMAARHLADTLESAAASVSGAPVTAVGGLFQSPEVSAAFAQEIRRRGIHLTAAAGTALDGALALGRYVVDGGALAARAPYLLCSG